MRLIYRLMEGKDMKKLSRQIFGQISVLLVVVLMATSCSANSQLLPGKSGNTTSPGITDESQSPGPSAPAVTPTSTPTPGPDITPTPTTTPEANEPVRVKAVYLTGSTTASRLDHFIELVNKTELNSLVIDIKENGYVNYESEIPLIKELGLSKKVYNVDEVLKKCHDNHINVIGRIVVFRDDGLSRKKPEYAIKKPGGSLWTEGQHGAWTNPYLQGVQDYNINIAKEAVKLGFDEIQFDYVRFPTAKASAVDYGGNAPDKGETISTFLKRAAEEIKKVKDVPVSADIFGIVIESDYDGKAIGQKFDMLGQHIDTISPMIYPSHYANASPRGLFGNGAGQRINGVLFTAPDLKPYDVVYQALLKTKTRIGEVPDFKASVRPYLQDFTIKLPEGYGQTYGVRQVKDQIKAVYDAGYEEWILWNGKNQYTEDALLSE